MSTPLPHHAPAPVSLAHAIESLAGTLQGIAESAEQLAHHAEGLPMLQAAKMLADLHAACELAEGCADALWRVMDRKTEKQG
jgi:hypothetical protein